MTNHAEDYRTNAATCLRLAKTMDNDNMAYPVDSGDGHNGSR
jgi:hypothetical protein